MGVRESAESSPEGLKLHEMVIEPDEKESEVFDIDRELTPEVWEKVVKSLETLRSYGQNDPTDDPAREKLNWRTFLTDVSILKLVNPEMASKISLGDSDWAVISPELTIDQTIFNSDAWSWLIDVNEARTLFPERTQDIKLGEVFEHGMVDELQTKLKSYSTLEELDRVQFLERYYELCLFSSELAAKVKLDDGFVEAQNERLKKMLEEKNYVEVAEVCIQTKLFCGDRFKQPRLPKDFWEHAEECYRTDLKNGDEGLAETILEAKILLAKKAYIKNGKLHLEGSIAGDNFRDKEKSELPVRRGY